MQSWIQLEGKEKTPSPQHEYKSLDNRMDEFSTLTGTQRQYWECSVFCFTDTWLNKDILNLNEGVLWVWNYCKQTFWQKDKTSSTASWIGLGRTVCSSILPQRMGWWWSTGGSGPTLYWNTATLPSCIKMLTTLQQEKDEQAYTF